MLRRNKDRYCPIYWSQDVATRQDALASCAVDADLAYCYSRGMTRYAMLLGNPWYAWRRDKVLVGQLQQLRVEYRELLQKHLDELSAPPPVSYLYPSKLPPMRAPERKRVRPDEAPYAPTYSNYPDDEEERSRSLTLPAGAVIDLSELAKGTSTHFEPGGGSFGGAGASGDWGDSSSGSCDSGSSDPSSSENNE